MKTLSFLKVCNNRDSHVIAVQHIAHSCAFKFCPCIVSVVIGFIGGFLFILLQVIFLVDFAHAWAESW